MRRQRADLVIADRLIQGMELGAVVQDVAARR
jgi:hypothetical protein